MGEWAAIEVADALELLSPDFKNDEVRFRLIIHSCPESTPWVAQPLACAE